MPSRLPDASFDTVEVLNGVVRTGDTVAVAVREGNTAAIRMGEVVAIKMRKEGYSDRHVVRLQVRVTYSSTPISSEEVGIEILSRVVRVGGSSGSGTEQL